MRAALANALWLASCAPQAARFHLSRREVQKAQEQVLEAIVQRNRDSAFGREHGFGRVRTPRDFQNQVPLASYDDLRPWIERIEDGETQVLTSEPVLLLEPSGGSSGARKLIPYTASLKHEFGRAIAPWIADLAIHDPRLLAGRAYWSLSPLARRERTRGGLGIGFEEDAEYFGRVQSFFIRAAQAVPREVREIEDAESFRYLSLLFLLRAGDLALISVWSPSFFLILLAKLNEWWPRLCHDIARGTISLPNLTPLQREVFGRLNLPDARRAREIRTAFETESEPASTYRRLWPRLRLISCWADAHAAEDARELESLLPQAALQGKGLLATEGVVSFPLVGREGGALAVRSHFFEFLPAYLEHGEMRIDAQPLGAHELEVGGQYAVVMSTGGGLWRYKLGDVIEVTGFADGCPLLRFVGRSDRVSDWRGEKLHEALVRRVLQEVLAELNIEARFVMLALEESVEEPLEAEPKYLPEPFYALFIESGASDEFLREIGEQVERGLSASFHYALCRRLEQLGAVRVRRIDRDAREKYQTACVTLGQRAGDVKPCTLHTRAGWARRLGGRWL